MTKEELRKIVRKELDVAAEKINDILRGKHIKEIAPVLARLGRGQILPHWFRQLQEQHSLPNLDGKTIGSVIEMIFVAVLEVFILKRRAAGELKINPARGVDIPNLDLGIKSPSENYCTSEPFFSAYERLLGNEHDIVVLLTDYQTAKRKPPLKVSIIDWTYLHGTEVADKNLCAIARKQRDWLLKENESYAKKVFRFLSYANQSDWRAKYLLRMICSMEDEEPIRKIIAMAEEGVAQKNKKEIQQKGEQIPLDELNALKHILEIKPLFLGVIDAADNWVAETHKDFGRLPNDNEWARLKSGPLDGKIGMSFALQWRYNFGSLFKKIAE